MSALRSQTTSSCGIPARAQSPVRRTLLMLLLSGMVALNVYGLLRLWPYISRGASDFAAFYSAGQAVRRGLGHELYNQQTLARLQSTFAPQLVKALHGPLPFTHLPFEAAIFAPLSALPYGMAYLIWDAVSATLILVSVLLLRPYLAQMCRWSSTLPFLCAFAFFPVFWCLLMGQDATLLLLSLVGAFVALKRRHDLLAGICCGLGLVKFQYLLPLMAILVLRRKWNVLAGFALASVALALVSAAVAGWSETLRYPHTLLLLSGGQAHLSMNAEYMPNLRGAIESLFGTNGAVSNGILALVSLTLFGFVARACILDPGRPNFALEFSLVVTTSVLVSYHTFAQDLTILLLPIFLVCDALLGCSIAHSARNLLRPIIALLLFSPLYIVLASHESFAIVLFSITSMFAAGVAAAIPRDQSSTTSNALQISASQE